MRRCRQPDRGAGAVRRLALAAMLGLVPAASDAQPAGHATPVAVAAPAPAAFPTLGPSFPCPVPSDPLATLICGSATLARLDLRFVQTYQAGWQQASAAERLRLRQEANRFSGAVRAACGIAAPGTTVATAADASPCVAAAYRRQRAAWAKDLRGDAAEEAARPLAVHVALQRDLQVLGLLPAADVIDGVYGADTRMAIGAFQQTIGESATGLLGDGDAARLAQLAAARAPAPRPLPVAGPTGRPGAPANAGPVGSAHWRPLVAALTGQGIAVTRAIGPGGCEVVFRLRDPAAVARAARAFDRVSGNGVRDHTDVELFNAVLLFLRTRVSARAIRALYADAPGADVCHFTAIAFTEDVYGRDVSHRLFSFGFDRATYAKVVWPRFDPANLPRIVSGFAYGGFAQQRIRTLGGTSPPVLPDAGRPASAPAAPTQAARTPLPRVQPANVGDGATDAPAGPAAGPATGAVPASDAGD